MSTNNTYTIKQLRDLAKQQGYKVACLFDSKDKKVNNYNTLQTAISKQLDVIENRLKSPVLPDGIYFVGMCEKYGRGQIVDKYAVIKGAGLSNNGVQTYQVVQQSSPSENVLTYESALAMQQQIAELKSDNRFLTENNKLLQDKINTLEADLKESENSLSEYVDDSGNAKKSDLMALGEKAGGWLKDIAPMLTPLADRYFDLKEKKIALEEKKIEAGGKTKTEKKVAQKKLEVGSKAFLDYIREIAEDEDKEDELDKCLDLLEANFPDQYVSICEELDLFEEEEEEEEEEGEKND